MDDDVGQPFSPRDLFHYFPTNEPYRFDWLDDILLRDRLYFQNPLTFNDPFDCSPRVKLSGTKAQLKGYIDDLASRQVKGGRRLDRKRFRREMHRSYISKARLHADEVFRTRIAELGVFCFTTDPLNRLMWSHYAFRHQGVCLWFQPQSSDVFDMLICPVKYVAVRPELNLVTTSTRNWADLIVFSKDEAWRYEQEWRGFDVNKVGPRPFRPGMLKAVIFGARAPDETIGRVRESVAKRAEPLELFRAAQDKSSYALELHRL